MELISTRSESESDTPETTNWEEELDLSKICAAENAPDTPNEKVCHDLSFKRIS